MWRDCVGHGFSVGPNFDPCVVPGSAPSSLTRADRDDEMAAGADGGVTPGREHGCGLCLLDDGRSGNDLAHRQCAAINHGAIDIAARLGKVGLAGAATKLGRRLFLPTPRTMRALGRIGYRGDHVPVDSLD